MAAPRFVTPELRLTRLVAEPGGVTAAEAVRQANANLEALRPTCLAEMMALLERAEALFGTGDQTPDLRAIYDLAVSGIGGGEVSGTPGVDETLKSLADLVDALTESGGFDRPAVGVHLRAWRLLMNAGLDEAGRTAILEGLRAISARHART